MFGFPIGNGDAGMTGVLESFTNSANSGFPNIQQREVFYSIKDGNWNDPTTWITATGRVGKFPSSTDDVYIRNVVTCPNGQFGFSCNNLNIRGILNCVAGTYGNLTVNGNVNCTGSGLINFPVTGGNIWYFTLMSNNNIIDKDKYIVGASVATAYNGTIDQDILDLNYTILHVGSFSGTKYLRRDLTVDRLILDNGGTGQSSANIECGAYNFTVNTTSFIRGVALSKNNTGNLLFIGNIELRGMTGPLGYRSLNLTGNPDVELRGGVIATTNALSVYSGTGIWRFTTNNQSFTAFNTGGGFLSGMICPMMIANGITLTIAGTVGGIGIDNYINGEGATSKLLMGSGASLNFATQVAAENSMTTGLYDFTTNLNNTIFYSGNYSSTIPSRFPTFHSLTIGGTGTKTLSVNTTLNGNLSVSSSGNLECSTYNLSILGTTTTSATLSKTGAGNILFTGLLTIQTGATINFSGNPNVELKGGIFQAFQGTLGTFNSGTGQWTFNTNNQTIYNNNGPGSSSALSFNAPILISGAITLTIDTTAGSDTILILNQPINGDNAASTLSVKASVQFNTIASTASMTTGVIDLTPTSTSTFQSIRYNFNGDFTIPFTSLAGLIIYGTGTKSLSANTTLSKFLTVTSSGKLECSTYNLTVGGATNTGGGFLSKTGAGSLVFIGNINPRGGVSFTGNPTIEFRGGVRFSQTDIPNLGNGQITFTTNSQSIDYINFGVQSVTLSNNILISGAITVTVSSSAAALTIVSNGAIDGDNASSKLLIGVNGNITYNSSTQPMATGILDTSTNLNTWIYGNSNQDIKGGPTTLAKQVYRNLTLNGGGTKTLQGYVSVLNTYTLTAPATLALNGFTLTNP